MSEVQTHSTDLAAQYVAQVEADLDRNAKEQARVSADLEALQAQLHALQHDHGVLVNIQQALNGRSASGVAPMAPAKSEQGKARKVVTVAAKKSGRKQTTATKQTTKAAKTVTTSVGRPSLVALVRGQLEKENEPRSAAEITTVLAQAHPGRNIKATVVRTTVENLVAKSQAVRTKQGSSVFYSASAAVPSQPEPATAG
ncbi:hypothetical protein [Streptomyces sp. NPDC102487]|uniref:hypothetical protein n=1 Tax=Streptomyces sp. NPDC102487 TaxID=3366182 RepID=UPI0037F1D86B